MTGKLWPTLYRIELVEKEESYPVLYRIEPVEKEAGWRTFPAMSVRPVFQSPVTGNDGN